MRLVEELLMYNTPLPKPHSYPQETFNLCDWDVHHRIISVL